MNFEVSLTRSAERYLQRLDRQLAKRVSQALLTLETNPLGPHSKSLITPPGLRSTRVGSLRIVFRVRVEDHCVTVLRIGPHGQVYRDL